MDEEEGFENGPSNGPKSLQEKCHKERDGVEEERRAGMRCHQDQRETSNEQPRELDAAALAVSDSLPLVSLHCSPHHSSESVDFDLELSAEVRVEDGSSLAFLSSISHRFHSRKSGTLLDHQPLQLKHESLTWISKKEELFLNNFQSPIFLPVQPQVIFTPESERNKMFVSLLGAMQAPKSPLPSCPSTPSSPSSAPSSPSSSPSSSSSSPVATATSFCDSSRGCVAGVTQSEGGMVSSTSVSLPLSNRSAPLSSAPPVHHCSTPSRGEDQENVEIYDPFHPTEGEGEREGAAKEDGEDEEEEVDKYDPFDPTGSPASEREKERRVECVDSVESEKGEAMGVTQKQIAGTNKDDKEMAPCFMAPPPAPPISTELPSHCPRHSEERSGDEQEQMRAAQGKGPRDGVKDKGKGGQERKETNSDNSEIEEGEIVVACERDRKRVRRRDREGEKGHLPDSSFLPSCPKPERILRVLEGDDFVSVRAEGDWLAERDGGTTTGVGDLRRKLVSRRKERYRSCPSSASVSPPPPPSLDTPPPSLPIPKEKAKSRKSTKSSKERERRKRKQEREGETSGKRRRKRAKEEDSQERKELDKGSERLGRDTKRKEGASWSSRSGSSKRKKRRSTPEVSSHSRSHTSLHHHHRQRSWSSTVEDRHKDRERDRDRERRRDRDRDRERDRGRDRDKEHERDRDRDRDRNRNGRRDDKERRRERDHSSQRRKQERGERDGELADEERGVACRQRVSRERDRERDRRRRDGRPVVPPSIQDLNGSDLFAIKRTITVTTTTTTTTVPGSPQLPQTASDTPPPSSNKQRKKKHKRKRRLEEEDYAEDEERLSQSGDSSLTPLRYRLDYDSDRFSDKLGVDMLSLDGEAMDSEYSLEDSPLLLPPLPPLTPTLSTKPKLKSGTHSKKKSRTSKKTTAESKLRQKANKSPPSVSPISTPSVPTPTLPMSTGAKRARKMGKGKEKVGKKEGGRSGKSKKLSSSSTRKGKLQSKVSVLVREGVSSTTGGSGSGKLGGIPNTKDLPGPGGASSGTVVGGSIAVVFRRDNESRSPFLKPSAEPILLSGRSKDFGKGRKTSTLIHPSSSTSHVSLLKSKKAKPSSTTSASSSAASSPSSFSLNKCRRKQGRKQREREKGVQGDVANAATCVEGGSWALSVSDIQSGSTGSAKPPSSPPPEPPAPTPSSSSSSSSSTSVPPPSSPPCTPPLCMHPSRDARESTPDSQTVDSSCKTPEPNFLSEDGPTQSQTTPLTSPSNVPSSPLSFQAAPGGVSGISQATPDLNNPMDEQKTPNSPPCSSSSNSVALSSVEPNSSVSSSSANKPPPPPPPPLATQPLPWSLQTGVDCTAGGVLALTALLFKMEEANLANRAKAQEFIQATSQILSQANQSQSQQLPLPPSSSSSSSSSQPPPPASLATPPGPAPAQFILHSSLPLAGCTKTPPSHLLPSLSLAGGCAQTPPLPMHGVSSGAVGVSSEIGWDSESKDPEKYMKKLHTQERAVEEVKLAIKPYYQRKDITKEEYKDILRKAVHKICHSRTGEINPVKVSNLVKLYVQRYKYFRKHGRKMDEEEREGERERAGGGVSSDPGALHSSM